MPSSSETRIGILAGISAYIMWGLLPLFIRALHPVPAPSIVAHRVVWSLILLALLTWAARRWAAARTAFRHKRTAMALCASTLLIGVNWLLYIYAINGGHTLQASLGYFINPLVNVLLGVIVLRERLGRGEIVAVLFAAAGVLALTIGHGQLPLIPLGLALTFSLYGLVRKLAAVGPIEGLLIETALLSPLALGWLLSQPPLPSGVTAPPYWMLMASGLITTVPLMLFAAAARRLRYSDLGVLQYISPTLQMLIAVQLFAEPLLPIHLLTFGLIWTGLAIYAVATWRRGRVTPMIPE